ncbi:MAG: PP2C family protein-serine/threonine phosphatase [Oscillospiraceae bacterium]
MKSLKFVRNTKLLKKTASLLTYSACALLIILAMLFSISMNKLYRDNVFEQVLNNAIIISQISDDGISEEKVRRIIENTDISHVYMVEKVYLNYEQEYRFSYVFNVLRKLDYDNPANQQSVGQCVSRVFETGQACTTANFTGFSDIVKNAVGASPVFDENGNVKYVMCIEMPVGSGFPYIEFWNVVLCAIVFVTTGLCILFNQKLSKDHVIQPLEAVEEYAKKMMKSADNIEENAAEESNVVNVVFYAVDNMKKKQERFDEGLEYARVIQEKLLTSTEECSGYFSDFSVWWNPLAIVSGDFYKVHHYSKGTLLILGDCTGHGIPGALMTMTVNTIIENCIDENTCDDTAGIIYTIDHRLCSILNEQKSEHEDYITNGLDIIVLFIDNERNITFSSAGIHLFIADDGVVNTSRGQRLFIGDGKTKSPDEIKTKHIKGHKNNSFYIATDGIFEQIGGDEHIPFGYSRFKNIIAANNKKSINDIIDAVRTEHENYRGTLLRLDDITMIGFRL